MTPGRWAMDGLLLAIAAGGAYTDVRVGRVYNALTYSGALAGLACNAVLSSGLGLGPALLGLLVGFVPLFVVYLAGGIGGGDVKLMAATGAFLGPWHTLYALLYACVAGGLLALGLILAREGPGGLARRVGRAFRTPDGEREGLRCPFALAILVGTAWAVVERNTGRSLLDLLTGGAA